MTQTSVFSVPPSVHTGCDTDLARKTGKRKTPSELRLEQLKRAHTDQTQAVSSADRAPILSATGKHDALKPPRFVDTRVADIYAATKPGDRPKFFAKEKQKDVPLFPQKCDDQSNVYAGMASTPTADFHWKNAEVPMPQIEPEHSGSRADNATPNQRADIAAFNTFKDVTQISSGSREATTVPSLDMVKAFKGMAPSKISSLPSQTNGLVPGMKASSSNAHLNPSSFLIQGEKLPLDLTLKTSIRFTSSCSFQRYQRMTNKDQCAGLQDFISSVGHQPMDSVPHIVPGNSPSVSFSKALHSWVHPQSVLPPSVMSALASSAAHGSSAEKEFLLRRQQMWEESFRSLYYKFRNNQCDIFYLSSLQILAMFISGSLSRGDKKTCCAYITRSTRGLRHLLQEQDIKFTMPLCPSELDTMTNEEIQELTEFEKMHPGQTRLVDSMIAVDNGPQSILAFTGHKSVHGLFDFLLNHRSLLSSTTGADVPVLFSPVSFPNAALVTPEVTCKQLQQPPEALQRKEESEELCLQTSEPSSMTKGFSLELQGATLPPWIVWRVFDVIADSHPEGFLASLSTDPLSPGLNIAQQINAYIGVQLETAPSAQTWLEKEMVKLAHSTEIQAGYIKHVKFSQSSFAATVSMV